MLIIDKKILTFNIKEIHFSDYPMDVEDCDFINFKYCKNMVNVKGFTCKKEATSIIDLTQDLDAIWNCMDNKSVRYRIKRAQKEGIKIHKNVGYEEFFNMYRSFMQKKGLKSIFDVFGVGYYDLELMKKYGTLFVAEFDGEIICGTLLLEDNHYIEAWVGASRRFEFEKAKASVISDCDRLIDWEIIKYAKEKGIKEFDLGGLWSEEDLKKDENLKGINTHKLEMGGKNIPCYTYNKIYSKPLHLAYYFYTLKNSIGRKTNA